MANAINVILDALFLLFSLKKCGLILFCIVWGIYVIHQTQKGRENPVFRVMIL